MLLRRDFGEGLRDKLDDRNPLTERLAAMADFRGMVAFLFLLFVRSINREVHMPELPILIKPCSRSFQVCIKCRPKSNCFRWQDFICQ
jgi:hypothetical protein